MFASGLTTKELNETLVRAGLPDEVVAQGIMPLDEVQIGTLKSALWDGYRDPRNTFVTDGYLNRTFSQAMYGTTDHAKAYFLSTIPQPTNPEQRLTPHTFKAWRPDLVNEFVMQRLVNRGRFPFASGEGTKGAIEKDVLTSSVTGSTGGGVLINQQVVPQLAIWFYDEFKALQRIQRVPAMGLDFEWNNEISLNPTDNAFLDDNGCPVVNSSTFYRSRTNIALVAVSRGSNLRLELAVRAGGTLYNGGMGPWELAMRSAIVERARLLERAWFQGTTVAGHAAGDDEYGKTFANGVNGWRVLTSGYANIAHPEFYPNPYLPIIYEQDMTTPGTIAMAIDAAAVSIRNKGGRPSAVYCSFDVARRLRGEITNYIRYVPDNPSNPWATGAPAPGSDLQGGGITVGAHVAAIDTAVGLLPIIAVPDDSIGAYRTATIGQPAINGVTLGLTNITSTWTQDVYVVSEEDVVFPYLGSEDPIPLEIDYGLGYFDNGLGQQVGCFNRKFIIYLFWGNAILVPVHHAKVRVPAAAPV